MEHDQFPNRYTNAIDGSPTAGNTSGQSSEAHALRDILKWSRTRPKWQRDALRRLCTNGELKAEDIDELTRLCKNGGSGSLALGPDHLPNPDAITTTVNLQSIRDVSNVNALKLGERLTFDKSGVTIVYGDNGSGKSGYARILKKTCRARTSRSENQILPNIYETTVRPQSASIDYTANGQRSSETWRSETAGDSLLSSVSVFDRQTANIHVDEMNEVAYRPFPMKVLEHLAAACQLVRRNINDEINRLEQQTPAAVSAPTCRAGTAVSKLLADLNEATRKQDVRSLATLDQSEIARFETLNVDLARDPKKAARQIENTRVRFLQLNQRFENLQKMVSEQAVGRLTDLYQTYQATRVAASAAAGDLFADEPLPEIGSDAWRRLWEAARRYSLEGAYVDLPFPVTRDGALCVLCQQELDAEASSRLQRFERFVKDETKRAEETAEKRYQSLLNEIRDANISVVDMKAGIALVQDELHDIELADVVRSAAVQLKWRLRAILRRHYDVHVGRIPAMGKTWPSDEIRAHIDALSNRASGLLAEEESIERKRMRQECYELGDRQWLSGVQADVIAEIERRKKKAVLKASANNTTTNQITIKSSEIAERLVTNALRARFSKEIERLGVAGLAIELRKEKARYGVPQFRVRLIRKPSVAVGDILSEGEHRCVALAAFLAELAVADGLSAIVFDDPVSSLDHMNREAVAKRLAEEGRYRQTIVFTHDIAFLFLLDQACRSKDTHVAYRCVTRSDEHTGFCQQDPPARAQPIGKVIDGMQKQLDKEKILYDKGDHVGWERTVDGLQKRLRWTWERAVEEAVGPVVKRLSNKVETKGLAKVTALTLADCEAMRKAFGRCSTLLHSAADELNPPLPHPNAVRQEITALREWVDDVKGRQASIAWLQ